MRKIYYLGYPGNMGGANTECWHTIKLWRENGWNVDIIPTWGEDKFWEERLKSIGVKTHHVQLNNLEDIKDLSDSTVVSMCNANLWLAYPKLKTLGCKIVWMNCMTFLFNSEKKSVKRYGFPDAYVFQSKFQKSVLESDLEKIGYDLSSSYLIRGAFDTSEFFFRPKEHKPNSFFVIGRLSRPAADKWSKNIWYVLGAVPYKYRRAMFMGWNKSLENKLGAPPKWAICYDPQALTVQKFLEKCHVLISCNDTARENWPRVGLEAMAVGVPLVVENAWGWKEMVKHGETGLLYNCEEEMAYYLAKLAYNEKLRLQLLTAARENLNIIANKEEISKKWKELFNRLGE